VDSTDASPGSENAEKNQTSTSIAISAVKHWIEIVLGILLLHDEKFS
jgi:hypothetical protein